MKLSPWFLLLSVALNVFLGVIVSMQIWRHPLPPKPFRPDDIILSMASHLEQTDRDLLMTAWRNAQPQFIAQDDAMQALQGDMRKALTSDPFDKEAFTQVTRQLRERQIAGHMLLASVLDDVLPRLSSDGRHRLATMPPGERNGPPPPPPPDGVR